MKILKFLRPAAFIMAVITCVLFYAGCKKPGNTGGDVNQTTGSETEKTDGSALIDVNGYSNYDLVQYITLASYKGVTVTKQSVEVTDEQINKYIDSVLSDNVKKNEITDRAVKEGDTLQIDYVGTMDNMETPEGMTADDQQLTIGSNSFIKGFEDGLIGAKKGDVVTLHLAFPDPYQNNANLSGQPVTFVVTVNNIYIMETPALTDDFVKTISDYTTVDDYKASVKEKLYNENIETADNAKKTEIWSTVVQGTQIIKYPETEIGVYEKQMIDYYTEYSTSHGYDSLEAMLTELYSMTLDQLKEQALSYAQNAVKEEMVLYSIVRNEKITLTQGEYETAANKYVQKYGFPSLDTLEQYYGKNVLIRTVLWDKTMNYLLDNAVEA